MPAYAAPAIAILVFAVILILTMVKSVPQAENWTVERFGRYTRTLDPGLRFLVPLVDRVGARINMMETVLDIDEQEVISRDNAMVVADAVAFYQVVDASKAAYEVKNLELALKNISQTNIRAVLGSMDLDEALSNRDAINLRLLSVIDNASSPWGVKVTRVEIRDLAPPPDITQAMARQMKAEREKRAEILTGRGPEAVGDPQGRGRARGADPRGRGPPRGRLPRRRGPRAARRGRGQGDDDGLRGDRRRRHSGDQLLRRPEIHRGAARHRRQPEQQDGHGAARSREPDRLGRRHRRARPRRREGRAMTVSPWWWVALAILLGAIEMLTPTTVLVWSALAALVTAPCSGWRRSGSPRRWRSSRSLSIVFTFAGRALFQRRRPQDDGSTLNRRADQVLGREAVVVAFDHGDGQVTVDGVPWPARLEPGSRRARRPATACWSPAPTASWCGCGRSERQMPAYQS